MLVTQTLFCKGLSGDLAKMGLFSQANFGTAFSNTEMAFIYFCKCYAA